MYFSLINMKKSVVKILKKALKELNIGIKPEEIESIIEIPPSIDMGDYAFPCFSFSEKLKMSPHDIAIELREKINNFPQTDFDDIQVQNGYVNFFIVKTSLARQVVWDAIEKKRKYGSSEIGKKQKVVIDFSSPNVAKPFGVGHLRSTIIGNSIANTSSFLGYNVKKINYLGDWGTQFGKLIYGFEKFGSNKKLLKDPIKHLLDIYVKVNKSKKYEEPSRDAFKALENRDKKSLMLWKLFRTLSIEEFESIYKIFGIKFDEISGESISAKHSKNVIKELKEKNLVKESQGALIVNLEKYNLGICIVQKTDGTTLYTTRDIAEAIRRYKKYKFDKMIYESGQEQTLHFKQVFKILELMGNEWAKNCSHVSHGLYLDKNGKKFATRKGKNVLMEDILEKTTSLTEKEIKRRWPNISKRKLKETGLTVALAAILYGDLKNNKRNNIVFDLKKFTSFEGDSGPYILYTYARAGSILEKADKKKIQEKFQLKDIEEAEFKLVKNLSNFPEIVLNSFNGLNPSLIANYCYETCQKFNNFYQNCPVIKSDKLSFRLTLVEAFRQTIRNALHLLGINVVEKM